MWEPCDSRALPGLHRTSSTTGAIKNGSAVRFECVDVFEFDEDGAIAKMTIVYDTYPIHSTVGDKYA